MKAIGTININFGLVNIPLKINSFMDYNPFELSSLCPKCDNKINQIKICKNPECENYLKEIPYPELKKALKDGKNFIVVDKDTFKIQENRLITIQENNTTPIFLFKKSYILTPEKNNEKQYSLLLELLKTENKEMIIEYTFRNNTHLGLIKYYNFINEMLLLIDLCYPEQIKEHTQIKKKEISEEELQIAIAIFKKLNEKLNINVMEIKDRRNEIVEKIKNGEYRIEELTKKIVEPIPLLEQLKKSIEMI